MIQETPRLTIAQQHNPSYKIKVGFNFFKPALGDTDNKRLIAGKRTTRLSLLQPWGLWCRDHIQL